jgi:hypothetical protein
MSDHIRQASSSIAKLAAWRCSEARVARNDRADAAVMLVAAELTLTGGAPAFPVPAGWPGYDIAADPAGRPLQRVQVKSSTFAKTRYIEWSNDDQFDWLAIVILPAPGCDRRRIFIVPREVADERSTPVDFRNGRNFNVGRLIEQLADFEDNFLLGRNVVQSEG